MSAVQAPPPPPPPPRQIRPSVEELCRVERDLPCPEPGCTRVLPHSSALRFHVSLRHRRQRIVRANAVYVCPVANCAGSGCSRKSQFANLKRLKQHYLKVHAPRHLRCSQCDAAFASMPLLRAHRRDCGSQHMCTCGVQYASRATLRAHATRHDHQLGGQPRKRPPPSGPRRLAPKPCDPLQRLATIALAAAPLPTFACLPARPVPPAGPHRGAARPCGRLQVAATLRSALATRDSATQTRGAAGRSCTTQTRHGSPHQVQPQSDPSAAGGDPPLLVTGVRLLWPVAGGRHTSGAAAPPTPALHPGAGAAPDAGTGTGTGRRPDAWLALLVCRSLAAPTAPPAPPADPMPPQAVAASPRPDSATSPMSAASEADLRQSAETQTMWLKSEHELFPELSELSGTDIQTQTPLLADFSSELMTSQTQTPWLTDYPGDLMTSETQTPWLSDLPTDLLTAKTETALVTHTETQTCLLCLGRCVCWAD